MRRLLLSLLTAATLAGCASTGYYREEGAADYYYERDSSYGGYYGGYGYGAGHYAYYDPFWGPGSYFGVSAWPYGYGLGYGYGSYYTGWPYYSSPWYDSWWGVGYNDWSWHRHQQQSLARQRERDVRSENAAVAGLRGGAPDRDGAATANRGASRLTAPAGARASGPDRWGNADAARQVGPSNVDPYYGSPRVRRGEGLPQREQPQLGRRETPQRSQPIQNSPGLPNRDNRPIRTGPAFNEDRSGAPPQRAPAPIRSSAPTAAPARTFAPAPSMDRAPSFTPRSAPSAPSRGGDSRRGDRQ